VIAGGAAAEAVCPGAVLFGSGAGGCAAAELATTTTALHASATDALVTERRTESRAASPKPARMIGRTAIAILANVTGHS